MTNLFDMRCPQCGGEDQIDIQASLWVRLTDNGTDADASGDGEHVYTPKSAAACGGCGFHGILARFEPAGGAS